MSSTESKRATYAVLEGNGAGLVRELALASRIQKGLETLYQLDESCDLEPFVTPAAHGEREALLVRETEGELELRLCLPQLASRAVDLDGESLDPLCQIIEGVSHFVYLANRAAQERATTQLELELQAEVDKYVVLASALRGFDARTSGRLRKRLFEGVTYVHAHGTELGDRYRAANEYAHRFTTRLERDFVATKRYGAMHGELRRFFRASQSEKLRAAG